MVLAARELGARTITVGIAEMAVSDEPQATIVTHALGSCIAVVLWDPTLRVGALLHYLLPSSKGARPGERPDTAFADTGVPLLFEAMYKKGCRKENIDVFVVGGASMGPKPVADVFDIGARNVTALRKMLFRNSVMIKAEEVGGSISRTVTIQIGTGCVSVRSPGREFVIGMPQPVAPPPPPAVRPVRDDVARLVAVGAGELEVIDQPQSSVSSGALGSSVAVALWDPIVRVGGMLVYQLPSSKGARPGERPDTAFADTGVPLLFEAMYRKGCRKETIEVAVVGGASMTGGGAGDVFDVGSRNITILRKILFKNSVLIRAEDVGGSVSRTVLLDVGTGRVTVRSAGGDKIL